MIFKVIQRYTNPQPLRPVKKKKEKPIKEKKKEKGYVVKITRRRGERFFDGRKFRKAVKKFKKALENEC